MPMLDRKVGVAAGGGGATVGAMARALPMVTSCWRGATAAALMRRADRWRLLGRRGPKDERYGHGVGNGRETAQ